MTTSGSWSSFGIALLALLVLGIFKPTRTIAIGIAVIISVILVSKKLGGATPTQQGATLV